MKGGLTEDSTISVRPGVAFRKVLTKGFRNHNVPKRNMILKSQAYKRIQEII